MIGMFDTRVMLAALEQRLAPTMFLRDTFFSRARNFDSAMVDIDIVQGKRRVAAYVSPLQEGTVVTRDGYKATSYAPPYVKPKIPTSAADILKRSAGEGVYGAMSPQERAALQLATDLENLDDMITRAEEVQAAQALFTGQVILRDANDALVYPMQSTHKVTLTGTSLWTDTTNSNPLAKLRELKRIIQQDSGLNPTKIIMGSSAWDAFLAHPKVSGNNGLISTIKADLGQITPSTLPGGVTYQGYLRDPGVDIYTYDSWYRDLSDTEQPLVPVDKILLISDDVRFDRCYGVIQDTKALYAVPRFPKSWEEEDPAVRWLMLQSAPLLVPTQVDGYVFAKVV
jgi:hypothetical protein